MSTPLTPLLLRECAAIQAFTELLDREADAMTQGAFRDLPELAERKTHLAEQISLLEKQREKQQQALGYAPGRAGVQMAAATGSQELKSAWEHLLTAAAQAHANNHRNGVMIHTQLDFTRQSIAYLKSSGQPLYGPDGTHKSGKGSGNSLALG